MKQSAKSHSLKGDVEHKPLGSASRHLSIGKLRTIPETAEILHVATRTVRRFIDSGQLTAHRFGRAVRISDTDIALFLAAHRDV